MYNGYGRCLDNIIPDKSKQPNAGRGVFAKRYIPMNGIVAPVLVLVFNNRTTMDITHSNSNKIDTTIIQTQQLLINYCYGHSKSSLLFFSYSPLIKYVFCIFFSFVSAVTLKKTYFLSSKLEP
jgi:hypothetical protein